jgi:hypothetical protein
MTKHLAIVCLIAYKAYAFNSSGSAAAIGLSQAQPNAVSCVKTPNDPKCW